MVGSRAVSLGTARPYLSDFGALAFIASVLAVVALVVARGMRLPSRWCAYVRQCAVGKIGKDQQKTPCFPGVFASVRFLAYTGGGIRTHTRVTPERILSPQRLPFRHAGRDSPDHGPRVSARQTQAAANRSCTTRSTEGVGFEPTDWRSQSTVFKTVPINHSGTPPKDSHSATTTRQPQVTAPSPRREPPRRRRSVRPPLPPRRSHRWAANPPPQSPHHGAAATWRNTCAPVAR
jgi:hypothetical protein